MLGVQNKLGDAQVVRNKRKSSFESHLGEGDTGLKVAGEVLEV